MESDSAQASVEHSESPQTKAAAFNIIVEFLKRPLVETQPLLAAADGGNFGDRRWCERFVRPNGLNSDKARRMAPFRTATLAVSPSPEAGAKKKPLIIQRPKSGRIVESTIRQKNRYHLIVTKSCLSRYKTATFPRKHSLGWPSES